VGIRVAEVTRKPFQGGNILVKSDESENGLVDLWGGGDITNRRNIKCKGPGAGPHLGNSPHREEASVDGTKGNWLREG
jgi:hypothetical protein